MATSGSKGRITKDDLRAYVKALYESKIESMVSTSESEE